jgi:tRNA-uridine 2-sulfurtransferase
LVAPDGSGVSGSASCGDQVHVEVSLRGDTVTEAGFLVFGCPAAIAGAEELVRRVRGRPLLKAASVSEAEIADALSLDAAKRGCSNLAVDALHQALEDAWTRTGPSTPLSATKDHQAVVVGMSGGVDSAVAALDLSRRGYRVVGVTFRLWADPACARGRTCCSPETIRAARESAHLLGLPHLTIDIGSLFRERVVEDFVREYSLARTPNPCVRCNADLRFEMLAAAADRLGIHWVATGHYARLEGTPRRLRRGADRAKDQSYVLAQVAPSLLERTLFPLGAMNKELSRRRARAAGLPVHDAPESQEICFIPDDDYRRFLRERLGVRPGHIVGLDGTVLGRHEGLYNFTIGQRKGLGVPSREPLYVTRLRAEDGSVVVGPGTMLRVRHVLVDRLVRHRADTPARGTVQLRSSGEAIPAEFRDEGHHVFVTLAGDARGVAPGQTAVLYSGERVILAGTIASTIE